MQSKNADINYTPSTKYKAVLKFLKFWNFNSTFFWGKYKNKGMLAYTHFNE